MQKFLDLIYIAIFGKHTINGFVRKNNESIKQNYIFDSVFPNEDILKKALPRSK